MSSIFSHNKCFIPIYDHKSVLETYFDKLRMICSARFLSLGWEYCVFHVKNRPLYSCALIVAKPLIWSEDEGDLIVVQTSI